MPRFPRDAVSLLEPVVDTAVAPLTRGRLACAKRSQSTMMIGAVLTGLTMRPMSHFDSSCERMTVTVRPKWTTPWKRAGAGVNAKRASASLIVPREVFI